MPWTNIQQYPYKDLPGFDQMQSWQSPSWMNRYNKQFGGAGQDPGKWEEWYKKNPFQMKNDPRGFYPAFSPESSQDYYNQAIREIPWGGTGPTGGMQNFGAQQQKGIANKLAYDSRFINPAYNQGRDLTDTEARSLMPNRISASDSAGRTENAAQGYFSMPGVDVDYSQGLGGGTLNNFSLQQQGKGGIAGSAGKPSDVGTPAQTGKDDKSFATGEINYNDYASGSVNPNEGDTTVDPGGNNWVWKGGQWSMVDASGNRVIRTQDPHSDYQIENPLRARDQVSFDNPIGEDYPEQDVPITPDMQQILDSLSPILQSIQGFNMTGMNQGIIPVPAQLRLAQTYFDPRRESIDAMSDELRGIANRHGGIAKSGAATQLANRAGGRLASQPGQMSQLINDSILSNSYEDTSNKLAGISQNQWNLKDQLTAQQQDIDIFNMKSKPAFADALRADVSLGANLVGSRIWDTTMRNKYGWTPLETGWVNAALSELAYQHNYSLTELQGRIQLALEDKKNEYGAGDFLGDLGDIIPG